MKKIIAVLISGLFISTAFAADPGKGPEHNAPKAEKHTPAKNDKKGSQDKQDHKNDKKDPQGKSGKK